MRDALSLLDQVLACSGSDVDDGYVMNLLGAMNRKILFSLSEAVFKNDVSRILTLLDDAFTSGHDLKRFYTEVLNHFRHLMLIKVKARPELLMDLSPGEVTELKRQTDDVTVPFVDQVYTMLFDAEPTVRRSLHPRTAIEIVFFKLHQIKPALPIDLLIERMDQLLNDPTLRSSTGIVESQARYGDFHNRSVAAENQKPPIDDQHEMEISEGGEPVSDKKIGKAPHLDGDGDPWSQLIGEVSKSKPSVGAAMSKLTLASVTESAISVKVRESGFSAKMIKKNLPLIESTCRKQIGRKIHVDFTGDNPETGQVEMEKQQSDSLKRQLLNHPLVADAVDIFNGKIDEIKIK
jgi:DNA polymerase-3 subunit gamma/tau